MKALKSSDTVRMKSPQPILIPTQLFQELDVELLALLHSLKDEGWNRPTVCSKWSVKDIASHLLDGSIRRLSSLRHGYRSPTALVILDQDVAWRVLTNRMDAQTALEKFPSIGIEEDQALGRVALEMVAIMA